MATIHEIDVFRVAKRMYPRETYAALIKPILAEQKAGFRGFVALHEAHEVRRRSSPPPKGAA